MKYFKPTEFICEGKVVFDKMNPELLRRLDSMREIMGIPMKLNSSYRTPEHNLQEGGKPDSAHIYGLAVDIACPSSTIRCLLIQSAFKAGFTRIGVGNTFVHVDCDETKPQNVIWTY
jgi:uncharacterized protein YcbK (DUF882 family)